MTTLVPLLFLTLSHYLDLECAGVLRLHGTEKMCGCSTVWLAGTHHQVVDLRREPPAERVGAKCGQNTWGLAANDDGTEAMRSADRIGRAHQGPLPFVVAA